MRKKLSKCSMSIGPLSMMKTFSKRNTTKLPLSTYVSIRKTNIVYSILSHVSKNKYNNSGCYQGFFTFAPGSVFQLSFESNFKPSTLWEKLSVNGELETLQERLSEEDEDDY